MKLQDLLKETKSCAGKLPGESNAQWRARCGPRPLGAISRGGPVSEASLKRFKVYVSGEKEPLILLGKNEKEVKQTAYAMIKNRSVKVRKVVKETKLNEKWDSPQPYSSKEAKAVIDGSLKNYANDLRKVQGRVVKDWMSKAKSGVIDFFDIYRGLTHGDIKRAHPYETDFLHKVLTKDKIIDRFRSYFGGKKGFEKRRKNK